MKISGNLDKVGTAGVFLTALMTPCCFPLFAFGLSAFGFGSVELFGGGTQYVFEALVLISVLGFIFSHKVHGSWWPLIIGIISGGFIFYCYLIHFSSLAVYIGMTGLLGATVLNYFLTRHSGKACSTCKTIKGKDVELKNIITCPNCGFKKEEMMSADSCRFFYECENCHTVLRPKPGECCVYCSYGQRKCPSKQLQDKQRTCCA